MMPESGGGAGGGEAVTLTIASVASDLTFHMVNPSAEAVRTHGRCHFIIRRRGNQSPGLFLPSPSADTMAARHPSPPHSSPPRSLTPHPAISSFTKPLINPSPFPWH
ncbi:unnamed protein product [Pleuronectes platessa]|uniref:Uncharacterized protein n=1 Tax=Pleuronectes platessa TaxID=8262 RepID=A0A9N7VPL3_PLEPL|nr:unnamed protein product [Pleuronectes platessa]